MNLLPSAPARRRILSLTRIGAFLAAGSLLHCSADSGFDSEGSDAGMGGQTTTTRPTWTINILGSSDPGGGGTLVINSLCGEGNCVPDRLAACGGEGGATSGYGGAGPGGAGFGGATSEQSCKLAVTSNCKANVCLERSCEATGELGRGEVCTSADECAAGLGCVGEGEVGTCQPYCCYGTQSSCDEGDFCDLKAIVGQPAVHAPVCSPIVSCFLGAAYPCPANTVCECPEDRACMVVRADGRTSCSVPGKGLEGAPCNGVEFGECAAGYVCAPSRGCLKLCDTAKGGADCPTVGTCQSPAGFSSDLGVCVPSAGASDVAP